MRRIVLMLALVMTSCSSSGGPSQGLVSMPAGEADGGAPGARAGTGVMAQGDAAAAGPDAPAPATDQRTVSMDVAGDVARALDVRPPNYDTRPANACDLVTNAGCGPTRKCSADCNSVSSACLTSGAQTVPV